MCADARFLASAVDMTGIDLMGVALTQVAIEVATVCMFNVSLLSAASA